MCGDPDLPNLAALVQLACQGPAPLADIPWAVMARFAVTVLSLFVVLGAPGCGADTRAPRHLDLEPLAAGPRPEAAPARQDWPYWPRRMRIHPLTQLATDRDTGHLLIEARIEFLDVHGHTSKGVGLVLIDLHDAGRARQTEPLETWALNLADASVNRDHYDDLTRTYLFRLEFDPRILPERPELRAYFRSAEGRRYQADDAFLLRR